MTVNLVSTLLHRILISSTLSYSTIVSAAYAIFLKQGKQTELHLFTAHKSYRRLVLYTLTGFQILLSHHWYQSQTQKVFIQQLQSLILRCFLGYCQCSCLLELSYSKLCLNLQVKLKHMNTHFCFMYKHLHHILPPRCIIPPTFSSTIIYSKHSQVAEVCVQSPNGSKSQCPHQFSR